VCGDAAVLFDPYDPSAIAAGISEALVSGPTRYAAGLAQAEKFTWQRCGDEHVRAYLDAAARA